MDKKTLKALLGDMGGQVMELNLGGGGQAKKVNWPVTIDPQAQIMTLREQLDSYVDPQFKVGDIVTVKPLGTTRGEGQPQMIVETRYGAQREPFSDERAGSAADGRVLNIRVMTFVENEMITCFWQESWEYELWDDRKHGKKSN